MATIRKRGNSYQIRVSCGYDTSGNQVVQIMKQPPAWAADMPLNAAGWVGDFFTKD